MKKADLVFTAILVPVDFLMVFLAGWAAYFLRVSDWVADYRPVLFSLNLPLARYLEMVVLVDLMMLVIFAFLGLYRIKARRSILNDFPRAAIGISAGVMAIVLYIFFRQELFDSRFLLLAGWLLAIVFVGLGRFAADRLKRFLAARYRIGSHRILLVGRDGISRRVEAMAEDDPGFGYLVVAKMDRLAMDEIERKSASLAIDEIMLADLDWPKDQVLRLASFCERKHLAFKFVPNLFQTLTLNSRAETLGAIPIIEIKRGRLDGWGRIMKRLFDLLFALVFVVVFSPVYLALFLLVKIGSSGPAFYRDFRYGYRKKKFVFYKFRSLRADLCDGEFGTAQGNEMLKELERDQARNLRQGGPLHKIKDDPRVTRIGRFLRQYSLDELPQFFNVIRGDMSVVGYRPHMSYEVEKYTLEQEKMFCGKPGITGLAQISGRSDLGFDEEVKLDLFYLENWSFLLDLIIILKTPFVLLVRRHRV